MRKYFLQGACPYDADTVDIRSCLEYVDDLGEQSWFVHFPAAELTLKYCREALQVFKKTIKEDEGTAGEDGQDMEPEPEMDEDMTSDAEIRAKFARHEVLQCSTLLYHEHCRCRSANTEILNRSSLSSGYGLLISQRVRYL